MTARELLLRVPQAIKPDADAPDAVIQFDTAEPIHYVVEGGVVIGMHSSDSGYSRYSSDWEGRGSEMLPFQTNAFRMLSQWRPVTDAVGSMCDVSTCCKRSTTSGSMKSCRCCPRPTAGTSNVCVPIPKEPPGR